MSHSLNSTNNSIVLGIVACKISHHLWTLFTSSSSSLTTCSFAQYSLAQELQTDGFLTIYSFVFYTLIQKSQILPAVLTTLTADLIHSFICLQVLLLATQSFVQFFKCACFSFVTEVFHVLFFLPGILSLPFVTWLTPVFPVILC